MLTTKATLLSEEFGQVGGDWHPTRMARHLRTRGDARRRFRALGELILALGGRQSGAASVADPGQGASELAAALKEQTDERGSVCPWRPEFDHVGQDRPCLADVDGRQERHEGRGALLRGVRGCLRSRKQLQRHECAGAAPRAQSPLQGLASEDVHQCLQGI